jgi:hypothetical protein
VQFSDLVQIAGITALITLLWAGSVAFTYWDLNRRTTAGSKNALWLLSVVLLPLIGFAIYLIAKILRKLLPSGSTETPLRSRRETALKRPPAQQNPTSTILSTDLTAETIFNREEAPPAKSGRQKYPLKYVFVVANGVDLGKEFILQNFPVYIGRDPDSQILLSGDLGVSRKHAEIYEREGGIRIRDLESRHGTQVNDLRIEDKSLAAGDRIQVGRTVLVMKVAGG